MENCHFSLIWQCSANNYEFYEFLAYTYSTYSILCREKSTILTMMIYGREMTSHVTWIRKAISCLYNIPFISNDFLNDLLYIRPAKVQMITIHQILCSSVNVSLNRNVQFMRMHQIKSRITFSIKKVSILFYTICAVPITTGCGVFINGAKTLPRIFIMNIISISHLDIDEIICFNLMLYYQRNKM